MTKLGLVLVLNLIGGENNASFLDQSHNERKQKPKQFRNTFNTQCKIAPVMLLVVHAMETGVSSGCIGHLTGVLGSRTQQWAGLYVAHLFTCFDYLFLIPFCLYRHLSVDYVK